MGWTPPRLCFGVRTPRTWYLVLEQILVRASAALVHAPCCSRTKEHAPDVRIKEHVPDVRTKELVRGVSVYTCPRLNNDQII